MFQKKIDYAYDSAIYCSLNAFTDTTEDMEYDNWSSSDISHQNPWYLMQENLNMLSVSESFYDILNDYNDPRLELFFTQTSEGYKPAPAGNPAEDPLGNKYSKMSPLVIFADAPITLISYEEVLYILSEAYLKTGNPNYANFYFEKAVDLNLDKWGVDPLSTGRISFKNNDEAFPSQENLMSSHIQRQKYISLWPYQSVEIYAERRRVAGGMQWNNSKGLIYRFPYPQSELSTNKENVPSTDSASIWIPVLVG